MGPRIQDFLKNKEAMSSFPDTDPNDHGQVVLKTKPYFNSSCKDTIFSCMVPPITMHKLTCVKMCHWKVKFCDPSRN